SVTRWLLDVRAGRQERPCTPSSGPPGSGLGGVDGEAVPIHSHTPARDAERLPITCRSRSASAARSAWLRSPSASSLCAGMRYPCKDSKSLQMLMTDSFIDLSTDEGLIPGITGQYAIVSQARLELDSR